MRDLALTILHQTSAELRDMHARGVVHRDIKLENLLVDARGRFHPADFGWAAEVAKPSSQLLGAAGTLAYVPLELLCGQPTDSRHDVFSLGVAVTAAALGFQFFAEPRAFTYAQRLRRFDMWLRFDCPRDANGNIDVAKLRTQNDHWAGLATLLIDQAR